MYKTLKEASEYLGKSEKTISRYIRRGILNPERIRSQNGTLEYRFLLAELDALIDQTERTDRTQEDRTPEQAQKDQTDRTDQTLYGEDRTQDKGEQTGQRTDQTGQLLPGEREFLYSQIAQKDNQIEAKDRQIDQKDKQITEKDSQIKHLLYTMTALEKRVLQIDAPENFREAQTETPGKARRRGRSFFLALLLILVLLGVLFINLYPVIVEYVNNRPL